MFCRWAILSSRKTGWFRTNPFIWCNRTRSLTSRYISCNRVRQIFRSSDEWSDHHSRDSDHCVENFFAFSDHVVVTEKLWSYKTAMWTLPPPPPPIHTKKSGGGGGGNKIPQRKTDKPKISQVSECPSRALAKGNWLSASVLRWS